MKQTHSNIVNDSRISHRWVSPFTNDSVEVDPAFYENNGTPIVGDDEEDALYVHTEVQDLGQLLDAVADTINQLTGEQKQILENAYLKFSSC
jgi:hypothetical protein